MSERSEQPSQVLGALPHRRATRRSDKRSATITGKAPRKQPAAKTSAAAPRTPPRTGPRVRSEQENSPPVPPSPARGTEIVGTAVQAAAELAEIGLSATARAIREAVARLPRP